MKRQKAAPRFLNCVFRPQGEKLHNLGKTNRVWQAALFVCFFLFNCAVTPVENAQTFSESAKSREFVPAEHLVFIGLDGWGGAYISKADMPTVKRMITGGASTLDMRCIMPSNSWPNWSSLFWGVEPESPAQRQEENIFSIFTAVKNSKPASTAALFYEWGELQRICSADTADRQRILSNLESARSVAAYIKEKKPFFTAVVFNQPDGIGHSERWGSPAYYKKLTEMDGYIAIIEQAVKDAGIYDSTVFMLSADHGGSLWGHGHNLPKQRKIPLVIYGRGIKEGFVIPSPTAIRDITPTMTAILGIQASAEWTGRPLLEVFQ